MKLSNPVPRNYSHYLRISLSSSSLYWQTSNITIYKEPRENLGPYDIFKIEEAPLKTMAATIIPITRSGILEFET